MCVGDGFEFGVVTSVIGNNDFMANGILGLAPSVDNQSSFVQKLYDDYIIDYKIVGLNFENPLETN